MVLATEHYVWISKDPEWLTSHSPGQSDILGKSGAGESPLPTPVTYPISARISSLRKTPPRQPPGEKVRHGPTKAAMPMCPQGRTPQKFQKRKQQRRASGVTGEDRLSRLWRQRRF